MTIEEFQQRLSALLAEAMDLAPEDVADELELQAEALRESSSG